MEVRLLAVGEGRYKYGKEGVGSYFGMISNTYKQVYNHNLIIKKHQTKPN
jgi:hypothetical protein